MKPRSIALIADYGFDPTQNYFHKLILWLKYLSFKHQKRIQHWIHSFILMVWKKNPVDPVVSC